MTIRAACDPRSVWAEVARKVFMLAKSGHELGGEAICIGRPFTVGGAARQAEPRAVRGWTAPLSPSLEGLDEHQRQVLAAAWLADGLEEHASVAAFARFTMQLLALGAPPELLRACHRASIDEVAHAELCFGLASAYAGVPLGPGELDTQGAIDVTSGLAAALGAAREGCVGETLSAVLATAAAEHCEDPVVTKVLRKISADETRHAGLAWRFVRWTLTAQPELGASLVDVFKSSWSTYASAEAPARDEDDAWMLRRGRLTAWRRAELVTHTLREVIAPCMTELLGDTAGPDELVVA